jgi:hypothetical protein
MNRSVMVLLSFSIVLGGALAVCATPAAAAPVEPPKTPAKDDAAELRQLQQQRINVLSRLVELLTRQYKSGTAGFGEVAAAQIQLVDAKLDATEKPKERLALLEEQVKMAKALRDVADMRFRNGACTAADVCRAKALCLEIKIKLLRERGKQKGSEQWRKLNQVPLDEIYDPYPDGSYYEQRLGKRTAEDGQRRGAGRGGPGAHRPGGAPSNPRPPRCCEEPRSRGSQARDRGASEGLRRSLRPGLTAPLPPLCCRLARWPHLSGGLDLLVAGGIMPAWLAGVSGPFEAGEIA